MAIHNDEKEEKRRTVEKLKDLRYMIKSNRMDRWNDAIDKAVDSLNEEIRIPNHISELKFYFDSHPLPKKVYDDLEKDFTLEKELSIHSQNIFILYAKEDIQNAEMLYQYFLKRNHKPWMDEHNLLPGQNWKTEISKAIKNTDFVIVLLSNKSINKRGFVQNEMKIALDVSRSIPEGRIFIIPVKLELCEIPVSMQDLQYIDINSKEAMNKILHAIEETAKLKKQNSI